MNRLNAKLGQNWVTRVGEVTKLCNFGTPLYQGSRRIPNVAIPNAAIPNIAILNVV